MDTVQFIRAVAQIPPSTPAPKGPEIPQQPH